MIKYLTMGRVTGFFFKCSFVNLFLNTHIYHIYTRRMRIDHNASEWQWQNTRVDHVWPGFRGSPLLVAHQPSGVVVVAVVVAGMYIHAAIVRIVIISRFRSQPDHSATNRKHLDILERALYYIYMYRSAIFIK